LTTLAALALSACAVGPNYRTPPTPSEAKGKFDAATPASAAVQAPPDRWWELYQDPQIDRLVSEALVHNTDLRVAAANLALARGALSQAHAGLFPTTQTSAGYTYGVSSNALLADDLKNKSPKATGYYSPAFDASYEVDLFGRVRRSIEAAKGDLEARAAAQDLVRVSVAAETTRAYADACAYGEEVGVARRSLDLVVQALKLTQTQRDLGSNSDFDVARAAALVEQTRAAIPPLENSRRGALYRLAVLTGKAPEQVDAVAAQCVKPPRIDTPLPVGDGQALLRRRPDVREAERTLAADTARVGVAVASFYPSISLAGSVGGAATQPGAVFNSSGLTYGIGPLISWNFPNLLVQRAQVKQAQARAAGDLASFDGAVLSALQDIEQSLSTYASELDHHAALAAAEVQSQTAFKLAQVRYQNGSASYLDLLTAEETLLSAETALAASDEAVASDQISVFKALGGGWQGAPKPAAKSVAANPG
jgi:NodT family efflux transporter outer membrane factor (OMF) lipoprotein